MSLPVRVQTDTQVHHLNRPMSETPAGSPRHPAVAALMRFFAYKQLPEKLQEVSKPCGLLAEKMADELPDSAEKTVGLRHLLEAKDCFVRAALPPE